MDTLKYEILKTIRNATTSAPVRCADFYTDIKKLNDSRRYIKELLKANYIYQHVGSESLWITDLGTKALEHEEEHRASMAVMQKQLDELKAQTTEYKKLADAAISRAETAQREAAAAEESAKVADKESKMALKLSRRSNAIAILSVFVSLLTGFFTKEDVLSIISSVLQWLETIW